MRNINTRMIAAALYATTQGFLSGETPHDDGRPGRKHGQSQTKKKGSQAKAKRKKRKAQKSARKKNR